MIDILQKENKVISYIFTSIIILVGLFLFISSGYPGVVVFSILKALILLCVIFLYGFVGVILIKSNSEAFDLPTILGIGIIISTFLFFLLGSLQLLNAFFIILFMSIPIFFIFITVKYNKTLFQKVIKSFFHYSIWDYSLFLIPLIFATLPPSFYDVLVYHLGIPNLYIQHGGFIATPGFLFSNTSIYYEISMIPAIFAGDLVPALFHFFIGFIFLLSIADFVRDNLGVKSTTFFLLAVLSMPMSIFLLSTGKNDLFSAFFIFLGCRFFLKKQWMITGLFWGFSIGVKYFAIIPIVLFIFFFTLKEKKIELKNFLKMGIIGVIVILPLMVKNYILAGNPVFPFLPDYFKTLDWDLSRYELMKKDVGKMYHSVIEFFKLPYTISFGTLGFGGAAGPLALVFSPFLLLKVLRKKLKENWYWFAFAIVTVLIGGYFTESIRFIYIAFIFLAVLPVWVVESIQKRMIQSLFFIVIAINIIIGISFQERMVHSYSLLSGEMNMEQYKASVFPTYPAIDYINKKTTPGSNILVEGDSRNYYLQRPYMVASGMDYSLLKNYLNVSPTFDGFIALLKKNHVDYLLFNRAEFDRLQNDYKRLDDVELARFNLYLNRMDDRLVFNQKGIFVYNLGKDKPLNGDLRNNWEH